MRFGTVAVVGRSNVGKTTLLNAALGEALAVVSPVPQTTRDVLLGVVHRPTSQIAFLDTPGLHRPRSELGRRMNQNALEAARSADVVLLMTDVCGLERRGKHLDSRGALPESPALAEDRALCSELAKRSVQRLLVINKVDRLRQKNKLLALMDALAKLADFQAILPVSMLHSADAERVLGELELLLPERPAAYDADTLTDRPVSFFVREYVREQVLHCASGEIPHAVAVDLDAMYQAPESTLIQATLRVQKVGQRKILVGQAGEKIRRIGTQARLRIEKFLGSKVRLELFVRVDPRWKNLPSQLVELGYTQPESGRALPEVFDRIANRRALS
ncbi:MAG TPA: GTPase Era [Polyangiaceae bacterium]